MSIYIHTSRMNTETPIMLIMACQKYKSHLLAAMERMKHDAYTIIGVLGTSESTTFEGGILSLQVNDTYEHLPKKIHAAVKWVHANCPNTAGIFKTDDDIFFNDMNQLGAAIVANMNTPYWGIYTDNTNGGAVDVSRIMSRCDDTTLRPRYQKAHYCYGHGYWLSKEVIPIVCMSTKYETSFLEDVCTGYVLNLVGVYPVRIEIPYQERAR